MNNLQTLPQQYFYEYGYVYYTIDSLLRVTDMTLVPFEAQSQMMTKTFKMQPAQPG